MISSNNKIIKVLFVRATKTSRNYFHKMSLEQQNFIYKKEKTENEKEKK